MRIHAKSALGNAVFANTQHFNIFKTMKYYIFIGSMLLLASTQCKKEASEDTTVKPEPIDTIKPIPIFRDTLAVWKNGIKWDATAEGLSHSFSQGSSKRFFLRGIKKVSSSIMERFYISDIPCKVGHYSVDDGRSLSTLNNSIPQPLHVYVIDEDQGGGSYYADTTRMDNFVTIIRYDSIGKTIEGKFKIAMKLDKAANNLPGIPDTISMTNGYFRVKLK